MTRSARIAVAAALLLGGTSLATAKVRGVAGTHGKSFHPGINETTSRPTPADPYYRLSDSYYGYSGKSFHPGINETTSRPTPADPYYRLSDSYYGYSDPYHGLFDFYAVPPSSPGYPFGHVRMPLR
ncbi:MAG: hypothetical protein WAV38_34175 [Xanthobacteraceae bacterium]|jgi:hypothetical protein